MENVVCVCAASLVGKVVSKRRNGDMLELRKQCVLWDVRGIVLRRSLAKAMSAVGGNELWSHREFCVSGGIGERRALSPLKGPRGEMRARCRERNKASHRHSQFWR